MVIESMETSLRTCFSFSIDGGEQLDEYAKISEILSIDDGVVIRVIDETYNFREAIIHINRFKDVVLSFPQNTIFNNESGSFSTCLSGVLGYNPEINLTINENKHGNNGFCLNEPENLELLNDEIKPNLFFNDEPKITSLIFPILNQKVFLFFF